MSIPVFLSYPKPHMQVQERFIACIIDYLRGRGLEGRTLGQNEYDMHAPLAAIRRLMLESNGILVIAFRRYWIEKGEENFGSDLGVARQRRNMASEWLTSPWCQIEPAMAFQLGLPLLIFTEEGVHTDGILQHGVIGTYMPKFNLSHSCEDYFKSQEWMQLIAQWEGIVRKVRDLKGKPSIFGLAGATII